MKLGRHDTNHLQFNRSFKSSPTMKTITIATLFVALATPVLAQQKSEGHSAHHPTAAASAADMTEGEIRKVDKDAKKLTVKHGEIKSLDMPPMTMVFVAKQPILLKSLAPGDTVEFEAFEANGQYSVGKIQKVKDYLNIDFINSQN